MATKGLESKSKAQPNISGVKDKVVPIDPLKSATNANEVSTATPKQEICTRDEKGRFLKGFSGNPHAWATRKMNTQLALLCRENVESNMETLQSIIQNNDVDPAVRVAAIKLSFEYGYGKPLQGLDIQHNEQQDYKGFIKYLAREIHQKFDCSKINAIDDAEEIKDFIAKNIEQGLFFDKIYDDVLKYIGSDYSFARFLQDLKEKGGYYKFHE